MPLTGVQYREKSKNAGSFISRPTTRHSAIHHVAAKIFDLWIGENIAAHNHRERGGGRGRGEDEGIRGHLVECVYTRTYLAAQKEIPGLASFASVAAFGRARLIVN